MPETCPQFLLDDYWEGREFVAVFRKIGAGEGSFSAEECETVKRHAEQYAAHLRAHIRKEDKVLYSLAIDPIPAEEMQRLEREFEHFETDVMSAGAHKRYHEMRRRLAERCPSVRAGDPASGLRW